MDELEEIRKKRLLELQEQQKSAYQKQLEEQQQVQAQVNELETLVKQYLTKEALQRFGNLKIAHKEKTLSVLVALGQLIQSGKIRSQITDDQFKEILKRLEPKKTDFIIKK